MNQQDIEQVVKAVLLKMQSSDTPPAAVHEMGVFASLDDAVAAAKIAQQGLKSVAMRQLAIAAIREAGEKHARDLAELAVSETGMGRVEDKFAKNVAQACGTPGVECLSPQVLTGDNGLTLIENAPWGVVASVTPSTNPAATVINNAISLIAAGNSVIFAPHPAAKKSPSGRSRCSTRRLLPQAGRKTYWLLWQIRISKPRNAYSSFRASAFWW
ncbi:ethanolamine utilization aldehyde dehydrogenase [Escherichia coli]|uniref:Ethanolamine utilization aldehyde dehydrogenase n=1 Tax=Escherichia coli TaxID=562 RepID=A0A3S4NMU8_ECOLX|nr:ethanolamine utilization aldehyde dehydrogenase [Escherichia coli]